MDKTIATIKKNQREEIRVALSEFAKDGKTYNSDEGPVLAFNPNEAKNSLFVCFLAFLARFG